jgi:hypothetical protein
MAMEGFMGALLDSTVGYKIPKTVRIRDRTLAAYACVTTACIVAYIIGWKLGVEKSYLEVCMPKEPRLHANSPVEEPGDTQKGPTDTYAPQYEPVVGYVKLDLVGHTPQINLLEEEYCR